MRVRYIILISTVSFLLGCYLESRYFSSSKEVEVIKNHVVTVIKEVIRPDGSKEVDTIIKDDSVKKDTKTVTAPIKAPNWVISGGAGAGLNLQPFYVLQVQKRLLGPVILGIQGATNGTVTILAGVEF